MQAGARRGGPRSGAGLWRWVSGVSLSIYWLEAMFGRSRLRLEGQGYIVRGDRWRPTIPFGDARFAVGASIADGQVVTGRAVVGGPMDWTDLL